MRDVTAGTGRSNEGRFSGMKLRQQLQRRVLALAVLPVWLGLLLLNVLFGLLAADRGVVGPRLVLILAAGSLALGIAWLFLCLWGFHRFYDAAQTERLEAGDWVLHKAQGRPLLLGPLKAERGKAPELTNLQRNLDDWLHDLMEDLRQKQEAQSEELKRDLELARDFQRSYMDRPYPSIPAVHVPGHLRLSFAHRYQPASALGGDFYNILTLASDCAGIFIADVMGHGTRSALITAIIRTLIDDLTPQGRNARHFITEINKQFCGLLKSVPGPQFASAFYFVADTTSRIATFTSAGHPAPLHVHRDIGRITRVDVPLPRGAALGLIPNEEYTAGYCRLNDGDLFLFFTDGLFEAHNPAGEEFGITRMEKTLQKLMYAPGRLVVEGLMKAVLAFAGDEPIADDICLVAVEVSDKPAEPNPPPAAPAYA